MVEGWRRHDGFGGVGREETTQYPASFPAPKIKGGALVGWAVCWLCWVELVSFHALRLSRLSKAVCWLPPLPMGWHGARSVGGSVWLWMACPIVARCVAGGLPVRPIAAARVRLSVVGWVICRGVRCGPVCGFVRCGGLAFGLLPQLATTPKKNQPQKMKGRNFEARKN